MEVTVSYRYSNKVDSAKDAPWEGAEVSITTTVDEADKDKTIENLFKEVKMQAWAELDVRFSQDENGILKPENVIFDPPAKKPRGNYKPNNSTADSSAPFDLRNKAEYANLPSFEFNGVTFLDFRQAKVDGVVSANHPEFKSVDNKQSIWMENKDGEESVAYKDFKSAGVLVGANV